MKQLVYRGYTIVENGAYVEIYKGDSYIKRIQLLGHWGPAVTKAKCIIDNYIKRFGA